MSDNRKEEILSAVESQFGFVPNVIRVMAEGNPAVADLYLAGSQALSKGILDEKQKNAVMLVISALNGCRYCTAAHSAVLKSMGVAGGDIELMAAGKPPGDAGLAPLAETAALVTEKRGWLEAAELQNLEKNGIDRAILFEIIGLSALKTITNYVNHISHTEIDPQFSGH